MFRPDIKLVTLSNELTFYSCTTVYSELINQYIYAGRDIESAPSLLEDNEINDVRILRLTYYF